MKTVYILSIITFETCNHDVKAMKVEIGRFSLSETSQMGNDRDTSGLALNNDDCSHRSVTTEKFLSHHIAIAFSPTLVSQSFGIVHGTTPGKYECGMV